MPFESGSVSFRMYYVPRGLPENCLSMFAKHAAPTMDSLHVEPIHGWVTSRHLLDRNIIEETAFVAGYLRLDLMKAERKIPTALLRAECRMEELAMMEAEGWETIPRNRKRDVKASVLERLLPSMPPTLTSVPMVCAREGSMLLAAAMSEKQQEALLLSFQAATGLALMAATPESVVVQRKQMDATRLSPSSFSPDCPDSEVGAVVGQDFLTWLWFFSEGRGGLLNVPGQGEFAVAVEGPLTFVLEEGGGAHETVLRKGAPMLSSEAKTCLLAGKKLRQAKVTFAQNDTVWSFTLDADDFAIRGLKLPEVEAFGAVERFEERMLHIRAFIDALMAFYDAFIDERLSPSKWSEARAEIHEWVSQRPSKR